MLSIVLCQAREYNGPYSGESLNYVAYPIGGIGAGMFCLDGTGSISHLSIENHPALNNIPYCYAAIHVDGVKNGTKVIEGPVPCWKVYGQPQSGLGEGDKTYGLPRFRHADFTSRFPFATINLSDKDIPLRVKLVGWSPFVPTDADNSSLPVGMLEYSFTNISNSQISATFSFNSKNLLGSDGRAKSVKGGFRFIPANAATNTGFAIYTDDPATEVNHCWFRGDWFDAQTIAWSDAMQGIKRKNAPVAGGAPGASLYVSFKLLPGETKTIKLNLCWYMPNSTLTRGVARITGDAFEVGPSHKPVPGQNVVSGFIGNGYLNTFDGGGDGLVGKITSPEFVINRKYLKFLVGGGNQVKQTSVNLLIKGKYVKSMAGMDSERMSECTWNLNEYRGQKARIEIIDKSAYPWGHVLADQFVLTDDDNEDIASPSHGSVVLEDFEHEGWKQWTAGKVQNAFESKIDDGVLTYRPWYASKFSGLEDVISYWTAHSEELRESTALFTKTFYDTTLPAEVVEAVSANLSILKSTTVLRQHDGRFWAWEGSEDNVGSCHGNCTHVWNYAQALPHLFPALERSMRETEFLVDQNEEGHQNFRANMPISTPSHDFHAAADGQLGGIMKVYRDWRISGDAAWLKKLYPYVKRSLDYCIRTWDPEEKGCIERPHHNTYDIEFWGAESMCTADYLGALNAFVQMSAYLNEPASRYKSILKRGIRFMDNELFNGEYYMQKGAESSQDPTKVMTFGNGYSSKESLELLKKEGPRYQYGNGCLSDGLMGMWLSRVCGLDECLDKAHIRNHLNSVYSYNLKENLEEHYNSQRPGYAYGKEGGLLLCTWPHGGMPTLPFVYSNEVWTGIEYQVAAHLIMEGEVEKGLHVVRVCRNRYNGKHRNPFDEIECGHWYARAMSSYSLIQALTGLRYDAVEKALYIDSAIGDFKAFICTNTGFGTVSLVNGKPKLDVCFGKIEVLKYHIK